MKILLTCLVLSIGALGCGQQGRQVGTRESNSTKAALLSGEKESPPEAPDSAELSALCSKFFMLIRNGKKREAAELFSSNTKRTAMMTLAKDIDLAAERPADYAPKTVEYVWYQNGKLWFRRPAQKLNEEDIDRLITLSKAYKKAVFLVVGHESGRLTKFLAVKKDKEYVLLP